MKGYWGSGGTAPRIHDIGTRKEIKFWFMIHATVYHLTYTNPTYLLDMVNSLPNGLNDFLLS
jgi:hypothetical protein